MPEQSLQVLQFRPGVNREGTNYSSEGGYYECDKVRFRSGLPEKIGGYVTYGDGEFDGVCRHYIEWASLSNYLLIGVGTNSGYYILTGGQYYDITPIDSYDNTSNFYMYTIYGTLDGNISATDTILILTSVQGGNFHLFTPYVIQIDSEKIYVPAVDRDNNTLGTALAGCIRGYEGTTAAPHTTGTAVASSWVFIRPIQRGYFAGDKVILENFYDAVGLGAETGDALLAEDSDVLVLEINNNNAGIPSTEVNLAKVIKSTGVNYLAWNVFTVDTESLSTAATASVAIPNAVVYYLTPSGIHYQGYQSGWSAGPWCGTPTYAVNLRPGTEYQIASLGDPTDATDFTALGASSNDIGSIFTATRHTTGTGDYGVACATLSFRTDGVIVGRPWNEAFYSTAPQLQFRLWSAGNFGQDLYFNARNAGIYHWDAANGLSSSGQVTSRGASILANNTQTSVASIGPTEVVVGNYYSIASVVTGAGTSSDWTQDGAADNNIGTRFFCDDTVTVGTGWVIDPATPAVATCIMVTDERHIVAFGCNDAITASTSPIDVENMVVGKTYSILVPGDTVFTFYGASNNLPGTVFVASAAGTGTGTVMEVVQDTMYIAWCSQEQPQVWWPTTTNTAGNYRLTVGTKIITAVQTRQEVLVFTDMAVYSMQYLGAPYVFGFNLIDQNATIASPNAHATANNITFWMGQDKFYVYAGRVETLPCSLRQYVFDDINNDQIEQVYAGTNEKYNEIWWFYPSSEATVNDRYVVYNYLDKVWYYGQLPRTAWLDSYAVGYPIGAKPILTDPLSPAGLTAQHEVGADDGTVNPIQPISAYIKTSDFDLGQGGYQFSFVKRLIPDVDFIGSTVANPSVNFTLSARNYPGIGVNTDAMQSTTSATDGTKIDVQVYNYTNQAWVRLRGRQVAMTVGSDSLGVRWQLGNPRLHIQADGRR